MLPWLEADRRPVPPRMPDGGATAVSQPPTRVRAVAAVPVTARAPSPATVAAGRVLGQAVQSYQIVVPAAWQRLLRAATFGLAQPGAAAAMDRERLLVARVRARRADPRVVGFVAGKGGVGTTTTAAGVALTLGALRTDGTVLVGARHATASLGRRLTGQPAPGVGDLVAGAGSTGSWARSDHGSGRQPGPERAERASQQSAEAATGPLPVSAALGVVDGPAWASPIPPTVLLSALEGLRRQKAFTVADVGDDALMNGHAVLGRADQVVLVTTASADAVEATRHVLDRLGPAARPIVACVCVTPWQSPRTARRLRAVFGVPDERVVVVPHDPALAAGGQLGLAHLRPATREAFLCLAGLIVDPS
jgi:MinD-like ATPase involved in chromosome partitioning or flagellar assembly